MILEMRVYRCLPGRLPALQNRFANTTLKLWEKHGIKQAGFFTTLVGTSNQELTYFLAWDSLADRDKKWNTFQADPEWIAKRAESEKDGPIVDNIVNQLLLTTPPVSFLYYGYDEVADLLNVEEQAQDQKELLYATVWDTLDPLFLLHNEGNPGI